MTQKLVFWDCLNYFLQKYFAHTKSIKSTKSTNIIKIQPSKSTKRKYVNK